ncbi:MAG: response regulator [Robiginitomaculum sp.]|nr:response regulator [Robiginitomaculum sp.]
MYIYQQFSANLYRAARSLWPKLCLALVVLSVGLGTGPISAFAQSETQASTQTNPQGANSLVPAKTTEQALRLALKIEQVGLVVSTPSTIEALNLDNLPHDQRLKILRQYAMDAVFFRNQLPKQEIVAKYAQVAALADSDRDIKIADIMSLQLTLFSHKSDQATREQALISIKVYTVDEDWFVANRAFLLAASGQAVLRQFDIGLKDAKSALDLIPNQLGPDYDEARYETYDFISYLQLILYNLEDGVGTTKTVIDKGILTNRQIDGISLISNLAFTFNYWQEYETSEKLAEILFRMNNKSGRVVNALTYYRYAQAQNNAQKYRAALATIDEGLQTAKITATKVGLMSERAVALAGLGRVRDANRALAKFKKTASDNNIKTDGYNEVKMRAVKLVAMAEGDMETVARLHATRTKTIVQRLLRFQNEGISGLHATLENEKARQKERRVALEEKANLALAKAAANQRVAYVAGILALSLLALALALAWLNASQRKLAKSIQKEAATMRLAQLASEAGERSKKQFLSVMSHEFRTPLNGIIGIADILSQHGATQTLKDQSQIILDSGESLLELLSGILDMTYLEAGDLTAFTTPTDIRKIIAEAYDKWQPKTNPANISFTYGIAEDVPAKLMLDVKRVELSLKNMVSNAVKFTKKGRIHIHVTMQDVIRHADDDENVQKLSVIVADTGIGISDEMKSNLFKPFVQADSSMTRNYGGAGIGLTVTRGFARLMGGDVVVKTKQGQGSEFAMTLKTVDAALAKIEPDTDLPIFTCVPEMEPGISFQPVVSLSEMEKRERKRAEKRAREATADSDQDIIPVTAAPFVYEHANPDQKTKSIDIAQHRGVFSRRTARSGGSSITPDQLEGLNVLIVEDILANQEVVRSLLEPVGCTVSAASNGVIAIELLENQIFDVILMDIRMPIMDGIETTKYIRETEGPHQDVPIIALTADASAENNATCLAVGADVFLTKPVIVSELFSSIRFVREMKARRTKERLSA